MIKHSEVFKSKQPFMREATMSMARIMGWDGSEDKCRMCNSPVTEFDDVLSEREYYISGMCQGCQDETFGESS